MSDTLLGMYARIKKALEEAGGFDALDDEQRDLFNHAVDKLMAAKFEQAQPEEVLDSVAAFLEAMSSESEPLPEEEKDEPILDTAALLIRAADALDKAGERVLANELDALLKRFGKE